jgi:hypothetical protein
MNWQGYDLSPIGQGMPMQLEAKKEAILGHETHMANRLAGKVIFKPPLSIWMILIPVIFIYYFWRLQKFSLGIRDFVQHWMHPRNVCIDEAFRIACGEQPAPIQDMVPEEHIPPAAVVPYCRWMECLMQHYNDLMAAQGRNWPELVRSVYRKRTNYLLFINQLNACEKALNDALLPNLSKETPGAGQTAKMIEQWCRKLRHQEADEVFG